jgi:arylsulfatase A-like enzyme
MNAIRPTSSQARTAVRALALAGLLALLALLAALAAGPSARAAAEEPKPSFVLIQTDDQTLDELYATYGGAEVMPETLRLIAGRGMTFNRYYVPYPLCCPSRTSLLTGRYSHNNGVKGNVQPNGGFTGFASRGAYTHNLAVWMQRAGYRTIHIGKFLNGYGDEPYDNGTEVPPGWSAWHTVEKADTNHYFYGYSLNDNGRVDGPFGDSGSWATREYGERDDFGCPFAPANGKPCLYETDVLTRIANEELAGTPLDQPFYLQLDYTAPHGDFRRPAGPEPAPRHYDSLTGVPYPHKRSEGFDEGNVSDKPSFIREAPYLSFDEIHTYRVYYQKALESLRAVDEGVREIVNMLGALHRLRNTYVIFVSDNGFFYGEHRLTGGKFLAYEPSTHLPFLIRGPHIKAGTETGELAANIDIAPTILELAGAEADKSIDGRSLVPYLHDPSLRSRRPILFESFVQTNDVEANGGAGPTTPAETTYERKLHAERRKLRRARESGASASIVAPPKDYEGIRLGPYKYIEWPDGEKELYDINKDPNELNNRIRDRNLYPIRNFLHRQLKRLEDCVGRHCQEVAPPFPPTIAQRKKAQRLRAKERHRREREKRRKEREKKHGAR